MVLTTLTRGKLILLYAALVATSLGTAGSTWADHPQVGAVQKLKAITFSLEVGSTEKETKRVTYTPPPGWYVRSHSVECVTKHGSTSYSVSTLPQQWGWLSEERVDETYKFFLGAAAQTQNVGLQAKLKNERARLLTELHTVRSTHHALVLDATVKGEGFWKGGGGIQLIVWADLVYIGTDESWNGMLSQSGPELR